MILNVSVFLLDAEILLLALLYRLHDAESHIFVYPLMISFHYVRA